MHRQENQRFCCLYFFSFFKIGTYSSLSQRFIIEQPTDGYQGGARGVGKTTLMLEYTKKKAFGIANLLNENLLISRTKSKKYFDNQKKVPISTIYTDLSSSEGISMSEDTISSYIAALKKISVIEDMPAWNPNLRSKTAIRASDTRFFVDPSVATAALGLGPKDLQNDLNTLGLMFETLAIRDLRVYAESIDGEVFHYRDRNGLECDAVIHLHNGNYGLVEVKLGGSKLEEEGAKNLKKLSRKIDTDKMNEPSFLMVLTGLGSYAYQREDGVLVVPIGCLKD